MRESLLDVRGLTKNFGALRASDGIAFDVREGETHAVIGPNGAGKTTFISQLAGNLRPDAGRIVFAGEDITPLPAPKRARKGLARSFQITSIYRDFSALENVALAVQARSGSSFSFWRPVETETALFDEARSIASEVGLAEKLEFPGSTLSHGEQRALEVGLALATRPKLVLLDEPMAGMGPEESQRMIALIKRIRAQVTVLLVEHDMDAVFRLADRISVMVNGRLIATGSPEETRRNVEVRRAYLGDELAA